MIVRILLPVLVAVCVTLPSATRASADDKPATPDDSPATVLEATMMVDAKLNGKDEWSPGGRQLEWTASKCPVRIQFKGMVRVDKPTKITYRWERSDGTQMPTQTADAKPGDTPTEIKPPDVWNAGSQGLVFRGAETFHVMTPSDYATTTPIKVDCQ